MSDLLSTYRIVLVIVQSVGIRQIVSLRKCYACAQATNLAFNSHLTYINQFDNCFEISNIRNFLNLSFVILGILL